jgi:hypothetical protein
MRPSLVVKASRREGRSGGPGAPRTGRIAPSHLARRMRSKAPRLLSPEAPRRRKRCHNITTEDRRSTPPGHPPFEGLMRPRASSGADTSQLSRGELATERGGASALSRMPGAVRSGPDRGDRLSGVWLRQLDHGSHGQRFRANLDRPAASGARAHALGVADGSRARDGRRTCTPARLRAIEPRWPREESNLRAQIRSLPLYPLSYGARGQSIGLRRRRRRWRTGFEPATTGTTTRGSTN